MQKKNAAAAGHAYQGGFERREFRSDRVRPRRTYFTFPPDIPKLWVNENPARTHLMNSFNLFLPPFERMIVRVIRDQILPRFTDPYLVEQARGFMRQEAVHGRAHMQFLENLRAQGYDIGAYMKFAEWFFERLLERRLGPKICLALVAAFEHYTDLLVPLTLETDFLDGCDPRMKELFQWHAAEEVEHNAVAYEMLRVIDDNYALHMTGNVLALSVVVGFILAGTALLLYQDGKLGDRETRRELREFFFTKYNAAGSLVRLFCQYARRDYRPGDVDYSESARAVLNPPAPSRWQDA
jgi:uncharacterized protein